MTLALRSLRFLLAALLGVLVSFALPQAAHGGDISITMEHYAFSPATITVRVGDTVSWTNTDQAPHDVTTTSAPEMLKSPTLQKGDSWAHTFTVAGTYSYICSIHPDMQATITVLPPANAPAPPSQPAGAPVVPARAVPSSSPRTAATPMIMSAAPAGVHTRSAPPAPSATAHPTSSPITPAEPLRTASAAEPTMTLRPLVLVAGIVTAGAVFCLLVLATRPNNTG